MRWCLSTPGSAEYILPVALSTSVTHESPYNRRRSLKMYLNERVWDVLGDGDRVNSEMHLAGMIELVWICTWRLGSSELRDALGGRDRATLEIYMEALSECIWRYIWRLWSSECREALRDHDRASLEMHLWRPLWSEFGDTLGGHDRTSLEMHLQAMIERDWSSTWRWSI